MDFTPLRSTGLVLGVVLAAGTAFGLAAAPAQDAPPSATAASSKAETFEVDGLHSSVHFRIRHVGVSNFTGRFNTVKGRYTMDAGNPSASRFRIEIETASIDTNSESRDGHLKSPDFFNAREFDTITFASTGLKKIGGDRYELTGDLSLHGVTKPVTAEMIWNGAKDAGPRFGYRSGFDATFTIKRTDFGMSTYVKDGALGDEVTVMVGIEGKRG